jgi:hypothetical protein
MNIIKYCYREGIKVYSINQAIKDGGWPDPAYPNLYLKLHLVDRKTGEPAIAEKIIGDESLYQVCFQGGGWLCLDDAIEQYAVVPKGREADILELAFAVLSMSPDRFDNPNGGIETSCPFCDAEESLSVSISMADLKHETDCAYLIAKDLTTGFKSPNINTSISFNGDKPSQIKALATAKTFAKSSKEQW